MSAKASGAGTSSEELGKIWTSHGSTRPGKRSQFAIENGPVEIVDLTINSMVIFHSYVTVSQRVS